MTSPKKISLVIHSLGIGGMERVMSQLADNFSGREGLQVDLILIGKNREVEFSLPSNIYVHKPSFLFNNARRTINTFRTIVFLRKKIREINPDAVLSFGEYWNNLALLSLYGLPYPVFISDRSEPGKDLGRIQNFLRDLLYPKAAGYIAQTENARRFCISKGWNNNIRVIGNPIRKIHTSGQEEKENIVLTVGRLIRTKHFDQLIRMFVEIGNLRWKLVIVGGDANKLGLSKELYHLIYQLDAENSVFLAGQQKNVDLYYRKSKIFAFTSSSEGFPNAVGEAVSAGLPVISYDCEAGPSELIEDGKNGYLIPLFDQEQFKEKLSNLMKNEELRSRMGKRAKKKIQDFDIQHIANKYYDFMMNSHSIK